MIPSGFIQDLLTRVDIIDVVGRHVDLRKAGVNHKGLCPFHGEKTPSFIVSPTRQTYHCFGCGAHGDAVRFLTEFVGLGFVEAVTELAQQAGLTVPDDQRTPEQRQEQARRREEAAGLSDLLGQAARHYVAQLKASPQAVDYLKRRGVSGEVARQYRIGYAPDAWRGLASVYPRYDDPQLEQSGLVIVQDGEGTDARRYDRFRHRIMFPIRSVQGEVIGFGGRVLDGGEPKYLNSPETPVFVKGRELYGLFEARTAIRQAGCVLVVEGYMDVVALAQLGVGHAVATLGTACTEDHVRKLFRYTDSVVFSFDGDAAGRKAAARAMEASLPHATDTRSIRFLFLPPEHDPDSYIREHGREAFERLVDTATPLSRHLLAQARSGCDMDTAEGRARFAAQAQPLWSSLPDGALARQMLIEMAREIGLPAEELSALWRLSGRGAPTSGDARATARRSPQGVEEDRAGDAPGGAPQGARARREDGAAGRGGWRGGWGSRRTEDPLRRGTAAPSLRLLPRSPADLVTHLLLSHAPWWHQLGSADLEVLHRLGEPHRTLLGWLERDIENQGPRPWAAIRLALAEDPEVHRAWKRLQTHPDVEQDGQWSMLRRALDSLQLEDLQRQQTELAQRAASDPSALAQYQDVFARWKSLKQAMQSAAGPSGREATSGPGADEASSADPSGVGHDGNRKV